MSHLRVHLSISLVAALVMVPACGAGDDATSASSDGANKPTVIATTSIVGDIVSNVVGDCAAVEVLMGPGTDPHEFEASAQQAAALLRDADIVVVSGLGLEATLLAALDSAEADGVTVLELSEGIETIPFGSGGSEPPAEHVHAAATDDPHIWQDPARMADAVAVLGTGLVQNLGCDPEGIADRAAAYAELLHETDRALADGFAAIPVEDRVLVTNHDAFGYLAARYGFEIIGTIVPGGTTLAEPSSADLADLVEVVRAQGARAIFAEATQSTALADGLAAESGEDIEVVGLFSDSLGAAGSGATTYIDLLRTNGARITGALTP